MRESYPDRIDGEPAPPLWEQTAAIIVIVMLTGALIGPIFAPTQDETPVLRLIWLPVYVIIIGLLVARAGMVARAWPAVLVLGGLVLHAWISQYWSIDPETTSRRVIALAITGAFSIYLGAAFPGPELPRLLMHAVLLMAVSSVLMVLAFPDIGLHRDVNAPLWRGIWYEKNQMGLVMVAGAVAAAACLASGDRRRLLPVVTLITTSLLVLATQSKTSLLCLAVGVGMIAGLSLMRRGDPAFAVVAVWVSVVVGATGGWLILTNPAAVLEALGKDPTLTGRTDIWDSIMRWVDDQPFTGYGYSAFWGRESVPAAFVREETGWSVPSAHNGWLDLLVQLGWPGAIAVGILMAGIALITVFRLAGAGVREGYWSAAYLGVFTLLSLSESVLLSHANLPWCLFLAIVARALLPKPRLARAMISRRRRVHHTSHNLSVAHVRRASPPPGILRVRLRHPVVTPEFPRASDV